MAGEKHKFLDDSHMSYEEVFGFTVQYPARLLVALADRLGKEQFLETLKEVTLDDARKSGAEEASKTGKHDMATFHNAYLVNPNEFWKHTVTLEIVENTEKAVEVKVSECLWAKAFRAVGAQEIGYAMWCHYDFGNCQGFNPKMHLVRTKTLMQGDDCCNHRWVLEE